MRLIAWAEGDRTVGDGTYTAQFETNTVRPSDVEWVKKQYAAMLSDLWDIRIRNIHVMTEEEHLAYTATEEEIDY